MPDFLKNVKGSNTKAGKKNGGRPLFAYAGLMASSVFVNTSYLDMLRSADAEYKELKGIKPTVRCRQTNNVVYTPPLSPSSEEYITLATKTTHESVFPNEQRGPDPMISGGDANILDPEMREIMNSLGDLLEYNVFSVNEEGHCPFYS